MLITRITLMMERTALVGTPVFTVTHIQLSPYQTPGVFPTLIFTMNTSKILHPLNWPSGRESND